MPLEDDQIFLHVGEAEYARARGERGLSTAQSYYMPSRADAYVLAFRNWQDTYGGGGPFGPVAAPAPQPLPPVAADAAAGGPASPVAAPLPLGPRMTREQLLDRYSQHTQHCAQCQRALKSVTQVEAALTAARNLAGGLALLALATALVAASTSTAPAAAAPAAAAAAAATAAKTAAAAAVTAAKSAGSSAGAALAASAGSKTSSSSVGLLASSVANAVLSVLAWLLGGAPTTAGNAPAIALQALKWAAVAGALQWGKASAAALRAKFFTGTYPPLRNVRND